MELYWKDIMPIDEYTVRTNGLLHSFDHKILTYLYQPLIGVIATGIYQTLWGELQEDELVGDSSTHHVLINRVDVSLRVFYQERRKLEAIGLLKTYQKRNDERRRFIYELQPPLSPHHFFDDGVLNVYLFNKIGKSQYQRLKNQFSIMTIDKEFDEITASFNDVFSSIQPSELAFSGETAESMKLEPSKMWIERRAGHGLSFDHTEFDFERLQHYLSDVILPKEAFNDEVKEAIVRLAFVYNLEPQEMGFVIQRAFLHDEIIDIAKLRKEVQKYYRLEVGQDLPVLSERRQPEAYQDMTNVEPKNDEEKLILAFERMSPYELLEMLAGGGKPTSPDLKIIEEILFEQKLHPGVMNVLIHYVMETNDQKLVKAYIEKIAGHWARKKIKTVREAMEIARSEHRKYQSWTKQKSQPNYKNRTNRQQNQYKQKLPKWMTENQGEPQQKEEIPEVEAKEKEAWLENYLKDI